MSAGEQKLDAGKSPVVRGLFSYFPRALRAVSDVSAFGHEKYKEWGGWKRVPDAFARYSDALGRHLLDEARGEEHCPESKLRHEAHTAWNALARLELLLAEQETAKAQPATEPERCSCPGRVVRKWPYPMVCADCGKPI